MTYAALSDDAYATTGLEFYYPVSVLKEICDAIRARQPCKIYIGVIQNRSDPSEPWNEPYDPLGWAGLTPAHVASSKQLMDDLALDGYILDYEPFSQLDGWGVYLDGPLVTGNVISVRFRGQYNPFPQPDGAPPWGPRGPDPIDYDFTVSQTFSGSSDATIAALVAGINAQMAALDVPQGHAYADTSSDVRLVRVIYNFTLEGSIGTTTTISGGTSQPGHYDAQNVLDYHCQVDAADPTRRVCYTDTEQLAVIDKVRDGIGPDYELWLDSPGAGMYGQAPYLDGAFGGIFSYNHGYSFVLSRPDNAATLAKLTGIHIMSYDIGNGYDPREALRAFRHFLPSTPLMIGVRVGPPDYALDTMTVPEIVDMATQTIVEGHHGAFIYALLWDSYEHVGDFGRDNPDINIASWAIARQYQYSTISQRTVTSRLAPVDCSVV